MPSRQQMTPGYQVVELDELAPLVSKNSYDQFSVAILSLLVKHLNSLTHGPLADLHFDVIRVQYVSTFPAIGARYPIGAQENQEEAIVEACADVLCSVTLEQFVSHVLAAESWSEEAARILSK